MQQSQQLLLGKRKAVSNLMDDEDIVCDTCGDEGMQCDLIVCYKCHDGAEHIYCNEDELSKLEVYKDWSCQECMPRKGTNKLVEDDVEVAVKRKNGHLSKSSTNCESSEVRHSPLYKNVSIKKVKKDKENLVNEIFYPNSQISSFETKKNESQQGEKPTKATTTINICERCIIPSSSESTDLRDSVQVEATFFSKDVVIPKDNFTWLGKFQIHNNEGITRTWDGIQAHLSTYASLEVSELANCLPKIIILEELHRLRIWPSQFFGNQVIEKNISLYFVACDDDSYKKYEQLMDYMIKNDFALKGNFDRNELLIFPSNILLEKSQRWNKMLFWGVFREQNEKNLSTTPTSVSNSRKLKNGNVAKSLSLSLNAHPPDGYDMEIVDEIPKHDDIGGWGRPRHKDLQVEENTNPKGEEKNVEHEVAAAIISLWLGSETSENDSTKINNNNAEVPIILSSLAPPSTFFDEMAIALFFLARGNS